MAWTAVILSAGKGTRMASCKPKALQQLAGSPLIEHILSTLDDVSIDEVIIIHSPEAKTDFAEALSNRENIIYVDQKEALGTAHALKTALPHVSSDNVLVLLGDVPLLSINTVNKIQEETQKNDLVVLTGVVEDPSGYGRIQKDQNGKPMAIIEELDCDDEQRKIKEINSGIMAFNTIVAKNLVEEIEPNPKKNEYYLTDAIEIAYHKGIEAITYSASEEDSFWLTEAGANYFAWEITAEVEGVDPTLIWYQWMNFISEREEWGLGLDDPGIAEKGAVALYLLRQRGAVNHADIINGSLFQGCSGHHDVFFFSKEAMRIARDYWSDYIVLDKSVVFSEQALNR